MKIIAKNRKAKFNYQVIDTYETGLVLSGTEIKSIRSNKISIEEAYIMERAGELYLLNANIPEYEQGNQFNHVPKRPRKLLAHKSEIIKMSGLIKREGLSIIPLKVYFKSRWVKVQIGICKGKSKRDKRDDINKREAQVEMQRALKHTNR